MAIFNSLDLPGKNFSENGMSWDIAVTGPVNKRTNRGKLNRMYFIVIVFRHEISESLTMTPMPCSWVIDNQTFKTALVLFRAFGN